MSKLKTNAIENVAGDKTVTLDQLHSFVGVPLGFKNKLINGGYDVWQRGTAFSDGNYSADRWFSRSKALTGATTYTIEKLFSIQNGNYLKFTVAGATSTWYHFQKIENPYIFSGKTMTISMKQLACPIGVDFNLRCILYTTVDGEVDLSPSTLFFTTVDVTSGAVTHSKTITIPDLSAYTIDANSSLHIGLYSVTTIADGAYRFSQWQFEEGSVATPFEDRQIQIEDILCKRYFQLLVLAAYNSAGILRGGSGGTGASERVFFPVRMRTTPTITGTVSDASLLALKNSASGDLSGATSYLSSGGDYYFNFRGSHGSLINGAVYMVSLGANGYTAYFDAEL